MDKLDIQHERSEVLKRFYDIPFENSFTQTDLKIDSWLTPEKAYKLLGLRMHKRMNVLEQVYYERQTRQVEILQLKAKINNETDVNQKKLYEIEIQKKESWEDYENKLAYDCIREIDYIKSYLDRMPEYTRDDFERGERLYFELKQLIQEKGIKEPELPLSKFLQEVNLRALSSTSNDQTDRYITFLDEQYGITIQQSKQLTDKERKEA